MSIINKLHQMINRSIYDLINQLMLRSGLFRKSPELCRLIMEYCLRDGKRIRSILFSLSYLNRMVNACRNLYTGAAALELFHLFALIQDDVIDNCDTRRAMPSLHKIISNFYRDIPDKKAQDLSIIFSDILYSAGMEAFFQLEELPERKETALKTILSTAVDTGSGQLLELIYSADNFGDFSLDEIYEIYDLKTARYTFCGPLIAGAQLAGATESETEPLNRIGLFLGRAYQIYDDLFECSNVDLSSSIPSDIVEKRKTILLWHLSNYGPPEAKTIINELNSNCSVQMISSLLQMFDQYGSFQFASEQLSSFCDKAVDTLNDSCFQNGSEHIKNFITELVYFSFR